MSKLKETILQSDKEKCLEYLFYFSLLCIFFIWCLMLEFDDAPDELGRYSICQYIFNNNKLPHGGDMEIRMEAWGFSYAFQPILSYILGAGLMKITALFTANTYWHLIAARFVSVICGVVMAVFVRKSAKLIFQDKRYQWLFTLLVCLLPQCMFMFVYVNTDSMALMSCAIITYAWLTGIKSNWNYKSCITLSLGIIFCALSYYNAYAFILCSIIIFILSYVNYNPSVKKWSFNWMGLIKKGLLITLFVFIGIGWWFIRSYILYDGDFLGLKIRDEYAELYATYEYLKPSQANTYYNAGLSMFKMLQETDYIPKLAQSFVGLFGNMSILLTNRIYYGYAFVFVAALIGLFFKDKSKIDSSYSSTTLGDFSVKNKWGLNICMITCIIVPIYLCTYSSYVTDYQPQGRYILPMVLPFMYFVTIGLKKLFDNLLKKSLFHNIGVGLIMLFTILAVYDFMSNMVCNKYWEVFYNYIRLTYFV